jgi:uncharacterized protein YndB with AHSA1/START domain
MLVKRIEMHGTIPDIESGKLLKYSLENNDEDEATSSSTVTDLLTHDKGVTTVSITDDVGEGHGAKKRDESSEKGWDKILTGVKEFVEEKSA